MNHITSMTASELSDLLKEKEISSLELTEAFLHQIEQKDPIISAFLSVCDDIARDSARLIDERRIKGEQLPALAGIPMALKDNICTKGIRTTCASRLLSEFVPPYNATVWDKLIHNGAVLLGKLNMDEFGMGSSTVNSAFGVTHNPHDPERIPGGSSGGSAAAVSANEAVYTLGTDTGGSVRQPAAFCGVVGLRPTYGRVSRFGMISYACSMDQIGIVTKTVRDNAMILQAIAGYDKRDATSSAFLVADYPKMLYQKTDRICIGVPNILDLKNCSIEVEHTLSRAMKILHKLGANLVELPQSTVKNVVQAYMVLVSAEASSNLARYDGIRYGNRSVCGDTFEDIYRNTRGDGFGTEVKKRILLGTYLLSGTQKSHYYDRSLSVREQIKQQFAEHFTQCDVILTPTVSDVAPRFEKMNSDPLCAVQTDLFTVPASLAGLPAISIPCGKSKDGLPLGIQFIAPAFREDLLYAVAHAFEQEVAE